MGTERDGVEYVGEASDAHGERVLGAVRRIAELHPGERIVVVTHGGSLRRIQVAAYGMALPVVENCSVWAVAYEDGTFGAID
jgi:broad specificity phosphatase PhoE